MTRVVRGGQAGLLKYQPEAFGAGRQTRRVGRAAGYSDWPGPGIVNSESSSSDSESHWQAGSVRLRLSARTSRLGVGPRPGRHGLLSTVTGTVNSS